MLNANAQTFLWKLIRLGLLSSQTPQAKKWIGSCYGEHLELPTNIGLWIADYWASNDRAALLAMAITLLQGACLDVERHTRLVAHLFAEGSIDVAQACSVLRFDGPHAKDLPPSVQSVVDHAGRLSQASAPRGSPPRVEGLLIEALRSLAAEDTAVAQGSRLPASNETEPGDNASRNALREGALRPGHVPVP